MRVHDRHDLRCRYAPIVFTFWTEREYEMAQHMLAESFLANLVHYALPSLPP